MKIFILFIMIVSYSNAFDFQVIEVTNNDSFNYFFSYTMTVLFITFPMIALLDFLRKIDR